VADEIWPEVMVTAHRRLPKGCLEKWLGAKLREVMLKLRDEHGMQRTTSGMATGGDQVWAALAMELRVPLRAAIPYPDQPLDGTEGHCGSKSTKWTKEQRSRWAELKAYAEATGGVHHVFDRNPGTYQQRVGMLQARNDWMLERDDAVVGIWAPANLRSGTGSCLRKAFGAGKPIILANLTAETVTRPLPHHWSQYLGAPAPVGS
jgi:hypothetical protein